MSLGIALLAAAANNGCMTARDHGEEANRVAHLAIDNAQTAAFGRTEPFTIERPELTLRRRLLDDGDLPTAFAASLGVKALPRIPHSPRDGGYFSEKRDDFPLAPPNEEGEIVISLVESLQLAAKNSRDYQFQKEEVFRTALDLDLEADAFRNTWQGLLTGDINSALNSPGRVTGISSSNTLDATRRLQNGTQLQGQIGIDLVRLLHGIGDFDREGSLAIFSDLSISIPLMRGAGRHIAAESLVQAERNTLYEILRFERFKRTFAVDIFSQYLGVLQTIDTIDNTEQNYRSLAVAARALQRQADAGRRNPVEVDQAVQDELRARNAWIGAIQDYERALDLFRFRLGLPTDANIVLDRLELDRISESVRETLGDTSEVVTNEDIEEVASTLTADDEVILPEPGSQGTPGPWELPERAAVEIALQNRLDLVVADGAVYDAQRDIVIAADGLRADFTLLARGRFGERRTVAQASEDNTTRFRYDRAIYDGMVDLDLPLERTQERNAYRDSWISLDQSVRALQQLEDQIKLDVRDRLRTLLQAREGLRIQSRAVTLAERRVASTRLNLQAGRLQTRDLLEAQEDLLASQQEFTRALIAYEIAELQLQRDMGVLLVDHTGLWTEVDPVALVASRAPRP